jgi:sugar transferase (PEP-CTERM/EpsH1 system associated)
VNILFLCHRIPYPPDKGEKIRAFHQLRAMSSRHEVDVFTLADDPRDLAHRDGLAAHCRTLTVAPLSPALARLRSLPYLATHTPLTVPYFHSAWLQQQIATAVRERNYDRIFVYSSAMYQYVPASIGAVPVLLDLVDVDSDKWRQYSSATRFPFAAVYRREARRLRGYERDVSERADCVLVTTHREAELAREIAPAARVHVVPMGVDTARFEAGDMSQKSDAPTVIFTGNMNYFPNEQGVVYFAREILPLVRRQVPGVRFLVVGRNPARSVLRLRELEGVEVSGSVPDVRPWLALASVAVAPLMIAAGLQNKILEAMASGLPIVSTARAVQGLTRDVAAAIDTSENAEGFAAHVVRLLLNPRLARERGLEGRKRVIADYNWDRALHQLLGLIEDPSGRTPVAPDAPQTWMASA